MKISIDLDCTPAEARQFFGLPDLEPLNAAMTDAMKERMTKAMDLMDPETMLKAWFPMGAQGWEQFQKFMQRMTPGAGARNSGPRGRSGGNG